MKKITKILSVVLIVVLSIAMCCSCNAQETKNDAFILTMQIGNPVMTVNSAEQNIDEMGTAPVIYEGRTLVPIRAIIEAMGGSVTWVQDTQTVTLQYNDDRIDLIINSNTAYLNDIANTIDVEPVIINNRTMLPIRFIAEGFRFDVQWNKDTQTIIIKRQSDVSKEITVAEPQQSTDSKILVVYYSSTGSTERAANYIAEATNADVFEIEPINPYTTDDLNWNNEKSRVSIEHDNVEKREVELVSTAVADWEFYDTVFIGYPIWWGVAAWPVNGFVEANDFTGKTVIPFCTSASSGLGESDKLLEELAGTGNWTDGKRFSSGASENNVKEWAVDIIRS